ncbi:MAG: rod shape-determining protein MreD [Methylococcales bacterium]
MTKRRGSGISVITIIVAMAVQIMPIPNAIATYLPDWILLTAIYWFITTPDKFGVGYAWLTGVFTDMLTGHVLGQHALSYSLVAYLCLKAHRRFHFFPLPQQTFIILILLLLSQLLIHWSQNSITPHAVGWSYWISPFIGALAWPFIFLLLQNFSPRYRPYG